MRDLSPSLFSFFYSFSSSGSVTLDVSSTNLSSLLMYSSAVMLPLYASLMMASIAGQKETISGTLGMTTE